MKLLIQYKGKTIGYLSTGEMAIVPKDKKLASDIVVMANKYIPLIAPTITCGDREEIIITESPLNGERTAYYRIYRSEDNYQEVIREKGREVIYHNTGWGNTPVWAKAFDLEGNSSPASNIVQTGTCFIAGTPVLLWCDSCNQAHELRYIENIKVGDAVASYDVVSGKQIKATVTEVITSYTDKLAMVAYGSIGYIIMAESHPMYTKQGWKSITNKDGLPTLQVGDELLTSSGYRSITAIDTFDGGPTLVYSLKLDKGEVYFVGRNPTGALVHGGGL